MPDYLPKHGGELANWASAFSANISATPADYGLQMADAERIASAVQAYCAAHAVAAARQTRTQLDVLARNQARKEMLLVLRRYVRRIKADASVPAAARSALKLSVADGLRSGAAAAALQTLPHLQVMPDAPLRHRVRYSDLSATEPRGRPRGGKPPGVVGLQLFCHVGEKAPEDPLDARFVRLVTRQRHPVDFTPQQKGQTAFYYGRWQTATGDTGPWSPVATLTVGG